jgi:integrase
MALAAPAGATLRVRETFVRDAVTLRTALKRAEIGDYVRPFHDGRHTSRTNAAAAGIESTKLMALAGHSDFATTQGYIDLAGEVFRQEAELLGERLFGPQAAKVGRER